MAPTVLDPPVKCHSRAGRRARSVQAGAEAGGGARWSRSSAEASRTDGALVEPARRAEQHAELPALLRRWRPGGARRRPSTQHERRAVAGPPVGAGQVGEHPGDDRPAAPTGARKASSHGDPGVEPVEERSAPRRVELAAAVEASR